MPLTKAERDYITGLWERMRDLERKHGSPHNIIDTGTWPEGDAREYDRLKTLLDKSCNGTGGHYIEKSKASILLDKWMKIMSSGRWCYAHTGIVSICSTYLGNYTRACAAIAKANNSSALDTFNDLEGCRITLDRLEDAKTCICRTAPCVNDNE